MSDRDYDIAIEERDRAIDRAEAAEQRVLWLEGEGLNAAEESGALAERARIVGWLNHESVRYDGASYAPHTITELAQQIADGDHLAADAKEGT